MSGLGRIPPRPPPIAVVGVKTAPAAVPNGTHASTTAAPVHAHHAHHVAHAGSAHVHPGHAAHATAHAPKPRRPPKPRKGRRKNANGVESDEDESDANTEEATASGAVPVSFDGDKQDGGDNQQQGGGDGAREDRVHRARFEADEAAALTARTPARRPADTSFATNRYHRGLREEMLATPAHADAAARVERLDLRLREATAAVARIESGGFERALANLLAHAPPPRTGADRPTPDSKEGRLNCMAFMKELNLQRRRTPQERQQGIAHLKARQRARTP